MVSEMCIQRAIPNLFPRKFLVKQLLKVVKYVAVNQLLNFIYQYRKLPINMTLLIISKITPKEEKKKYETQKNVKRQYISYGVGCICTKILTGEWQMHFSTGLRYSCSKVVLHRSRRKTVRCSVLVGNARIQNLSVVKLYGTIQ